MDYTNAADERLDNLRPILMRKHKHIIIVRPLSIYEATAEVAHSIKRPLWLYNYCYMQIIYIICNNYSIC